MKNTISIIPELSKAIAFSIVPLFLAGSLITQTSVQANPAVAIAGEQAMNSVLDNLRNSIHDILERLDQSVSSGTFLTRMQMQILLGEIDSRATNVIGKTFDQIDQSQQLFFRNTQQSIADIEKLGDTMTENVDGILDKTAFVLATIPLTTKEPRLKNSSPKVITPPSSKTTDTKLTVSGLWLANGAATLSFEKADCKLVDLKEVNASFNCPNNLFVTADSSIHIVTGELTFVGNIGLFEWFATFFVKPWSIKKYPISVAIVPELFGHVSIAATHKIKNTVYQARNRNYDTGARHCTWGSETLINITPDTGWNIDTGSIVVTAASSNRGNHELRNVTNSGFQLYARGLNTGNCVKVMGQVISKDGRGWENGTFAWREFKQDDVPTTENILDSDLRWGDSKVAQLPENTESYAVTLKLFNGNIREYNAQIKDALFTIVQDDQNKSVRVNPNTIASAFQ